MCSSLTLVDEPKMTFIVTFSQHQLFAALLGDLAGRLLVGHLQDFEDKARLITAPYCKNASAPRSALAAEAEVAAEAAAAAAAVAAAARGRG